METGGEDILKFSKWIAAKFRSSCVSYEDRVGIATLAIVKTLSSIKDGVSASSRLCLLEAHKQIKSAEQKQKKYSTNRDFDYLSSKEKDPDIQTVVETIMDSLGPTGKEIVYARLWENKTWTEVSEKLNLNVEICRDIYASAIKQLKNKYNG
ncbi:MAG: hypothetical protein KOO65_08475 [Desulfobacterales bacterium]|nr:hypothetical protein [Desulfobacterales bacterium]